VGGRVIDDYSRALFAVMDDGFNPGIWKEAMENGDDPDKTPHYVHPRYIEACKKEKRVINYQDNIHLNPLPQKIPVPAFS
jgi:hypothetical protein